MMLRKLFLVFSACLAWQACLAAESAFPEAQEIVEEIVAGHPNVVRLTIHAVPSEDTMSRIIACNVPEKLGQASDPEDLEAMRTSKTTVLREGENIDVTVPITDWEGRPIATGVTLAGRDASDDQAAVEEAQAIALELQESIRAAGHPLW
ncbi:hypothetical protein Thimo_1759 [Thioflavicoccus mobilis 8321]|uniref:Uncharacterized protein n=2 Tax=Thioflavicoccus mobilis TaxID=80679 RepID=L0GUW2_9GAMM|nr:hypothetical protein Thimo_1759 [Thioflavicoccus mobilis 8321]